MGFWLVHRCKINVYLQRHDLNGGGWGAQGRDKLPPMSTTQERPTTERVPNRCKGTERIGPEDQRDAHALQFVLSYAPPDADWNTLWRVYRDGLDPREVW